MTTKKNSKTKSKSKRAKHASGKPNGKRANAKHAGKRTNDAAGNGEDRRLEKARVFIDTLKAEFAKPDHGGGVAAVAKTLGMTETAVVSRAYAYRKRGIKLPKFPSGGQVYPWDDLAKYAAGGRTPKKLGVKRTKPAAKAKAKAKTKPKAKAPAKPKVHRAKPAVKPKAAAPAVASA